jgi:hypothetical protein
LNSAIASRPMSENSAGAGRDPATSVAAAAKANACSSVARSLWRRLDQSDDMRSLDQQGRLVLKKTVARGNIKVTGIERP